MRLSQKPSRPRHVGGGEEDKGIREKWKIVHGRRERLGYTAERLALEIEQKVRLPDPQSNKQERQLRMSLSRASLA